MAYICGGGRPDGGDDDDDDDDEDLWVVVVVDAGLLEMPSMCAWCCCFLDGDGDVVPQVILSEDQYNCMMASP
jgi:hypothetical protein